MEEVVKRVNKWAVLSLAFVAITAFDTVVNAPIIDMFQRPHIRAPYTTYFHSYFTIYH
jgi:hypothetical protein